MRVGQTLFPIVMGFMTGWDFLHPEEVEVLAEAEHANDHCCADSSDRHNIAEVAADFQGSLGLNRSTAHFNSLSSGSSS